jgi:transposase
MSSKTANQDQRKNRYVRFSRLEVSTTAAKAEKQYLRGLEKGGVMRYWIGFDIGKRFHWLCVLDQDGEMIFSKRVDATEELLEAACSEIAALGEAQERVVGIDMVGGLATLLETILLERGEQVRYIPGTAVNKVRDAYSGGEHKSDPKDAFVIADQLRLRWRSLREIRLREEYALELKTLVSYRRDLVQDQRRRVCRLRELLSQVFPGLEAALPDLAEKGALLTVAKVACPSDVRRLGKSRLARWLKSRGSRIGQKTWPRGLSRPPKPSSANCLPQGSRRPWSPRSLGRS